MILYYVDEEGKINCTKYIPILFESQRGITKLCKQQRLVDMKIQFNCNLITKVSIQNIY